MMAFSSYSNRFQYSENEKFQMLSLSYQSSEMDMKIILPKERYGLGDVIKNLTAAELYKHLSNQECQEVIVKIPRFEVNTKFDAVESLKGMGINELFTSQANLEGMTDSKPMFVSSVFHTAFVYVNF